MQNNEYTDDVLLFPDGIANWNQEKTNKSLNAHGVSVIEIAQQRKRRHGCLGLDDWQLLGPTSAATTATTTATTTASGASFVRRSTRAASPA